MQRRTWNPVFRLIGILLGLWLVFDLAARLVGDILWFQAIGYLSAFLVRIKTQLAIWVVVDGISVSFLLGNLFLAHQRKHPKEILEFQETAVRNEVWSAPGEKPFSRVQTVNLNNQTQENSTTPRILGLAWTLPIALSLSLVIGLMLLHYGQVALGYWHPDLSRPSILQAQPRPFQLSDVWQLSQQIPSQIWQLSVLIGTLIVLIVNPLFWLTVLAVILSLIFGLVLSGQWTKILLFFHPHSFQSVDPLFRHDISFYVFTLPIYQLAEFWLSGLFLFTLLSVTLVYWLSGDSFSQGRFAGFSQAQRRHLYGLGGALMLMVAWRYWLLRYELLYSSRGVAYGASYTDVTVELPVYTGLSLIALGTAGFLLGRTFFWSKHLRPPIRKPALFIGVYLIGAILSSWVLPSAVQRLIVQPNELAKEQPYIQRSIAFTRQAFDLEDINRETFDPQGELSYADIQANDLTVDNIRLWDKRPLLQTNRQLQQIRLYYKFPDADIDRYSLRRGVGAENQQVIIAPRELDYGEVPEQAKTWVNKHLIYTHGYGFTLSPVNTVGVGGLPDYFVKDIGTGGSETGALRTSSEDIRQSIPIGKPRIYYGELTNTYVMTSTKARELDYPSGNENVYNTYDGRGGVTISSWWQRLLFAEYLKDWQMLFTQNFTPQTRLLFRRNINQRIRAIAPFLQYDRDPYLVVADAGNPYNTPTSNYLYWIVDAYTTSDRYPYSDPGQYEFNYIRNSVKVVIDAYNGSADFYVADSQDPIINSWTEIFPGLFKPLSAMPPALRRHIRYPLDFFSAQSERLLTYHMTDPQVFYNREDQWRIPNEIYGTEPKAVEPYFLIMKLPSAETEEFILLLPFTPIQRNNLIAWLAARSDGENYGKLLLYEFPKQQLVYGTEQIEALINQDPVISQQISLWNRQGSKALQGNLLVIPIERSLLYVEPLYLEAEQNSLPTLVRVIVVYENRIVMAQTLEQALQEVFRPAEPTAEPIIRPLEPGLEGTSPAE